MTWLRALALAAALGSGLGLFTVGCRTEPPFNPAEVRRLSDGRGVQLDALYCIERTPDGQVLLETPRFDDEFRAWWTACTRNPVYRERVKPAPDTRLRVLPR